MTEIRLIRLSPFRSIFRVCFRPASAASLSLYKTSYDSASLSVDEKKDFRIKIKVHVGTARKITRKRNQAKANENLTLRSFFYQLPTCGASV